MPILIRRPQEEHKEPAATGPQFRPRRVLVVEDHLVTAKSLQMLLDDSGPLVRVAHCGPDGIRQARADKPDVMLCDIGLPGEMDGYAVAQAMRADPELRSTYLIAITGFGQDQDRQRAREAGFDVHLVKPIDVGELERIIISQ